MVNRGLQKLTGNCKTPVTENPLSSVPERSKQQLIACYSSFCGTDLREGQSGEASLIVSRIKACQRPIRHRTGAEVGLAE